MSTKSKFSASLNAFTLIELLVVISIIALLIGILLPALSSARVSALKMKSNTRLRGMHQGLIIHAQNNKGFYTGFDAASTKWKAKWKGYDMISIDTNGTMPEVRFSELTQFNYVTSEYLIHPAEPFDKQPWKEGGPDFDYIHYSYALNELGWDDGLPAYKNVREEWSETLDARTPVISDRLYKLVGGSVNQWNHDYYIGMYNDKPGSLEAGIVWNDGHVAFSNSPVVENTYIGRVTNTLDNIYSRGADSQEGNVQKPTPDSINEGCSARMNSRQWDAEQPEH
ncbi:hypothetical protein KS4_13420 [Poriferisphaera corsica]|uniref:Prepilin-type N-terminal cleavage/methylation domain-containing protein n=1 Tax=Poriferisphaera corsica TaxID=2528020 RepID=A0A517YST8_9BACT|nr:prepilin-type N-terminal cleavage/methylation domain-containing protein [Poriferisphaera corsica]QDU33296.1 hypothetical protein KS4_13420 [Poriferisphaera corsica]